MNPNNETIVADVESLAQDDVVDVYAKLAESYRRIKKENSELQQRIHQTESQNRMLIASQNDFQQELDSISSTCDEKLKAAEKQSEKKAESMREKCSTVEAEKIQLEVQVDELNVQLHFLREDFDALQVKMRDQPKFRHSDSHSKLLEGEIENLQQTVKELTEKLEVEARENVEKCARMAELSEKILCLEDNLETKKMELEEKNESLESLQEKIQDLTVELVMLKSAPDDAKRKGNSLFAEVDDQRQKMKAILKGERQHYLDMKKSFNAKEMEIRRVKRENMNIKQEIQACSNLLVRGEQVAIQTLTSHVAHLKNENRKLASAVESAEEKVNSLARGQGIDWVESLMVSQKSESRDLKEKLFTVMVDQSSLSTNFHKSQKELARARVDCVKLKVLLGRIIESNDIKINDHDYLDIGLEQEVLENLKIEEFEAVDEMEHEDREGLNESTIVLLGGRERLGNAIPPVENEKENQKPSGKVEKLPSPTVKLESPIKPRRDHHRVELKSPTKSTFNSPLKPLRELQPDEPKIVKFSDVVDSKVIDSTREEFEASQAARKRPGIIIKRIVIPSRTAKQ